MTESTFALTPIDLDTALASLRPRRLRMAAAGELDYWINKRRESWGRLRGPNGRPV